jgi:hypothetical protein
MRIFGTAFVALTLLAAAGCANMSNTEQRVVSGAAIGAATGASIGVVAGGLGIGTGALIGAGVGAAAGFIVDETAAD